MMDEEVLEYSFLYILSFYKWVCGKVVLRVKTWCNVKPPAVMSNSGTNTAVTRGRSMMSCSS